MSGNTVPRITEAEHIGPDDTGDNIQAKRVAAYGWNGTEWQRQSSSLGRLVTENFDYIEASYPDGVTEVYVYKVGGSGGTLVATVTVIYSDSSKAELTSVERT